MERIFVYGTLKKGLSNDHVLSRLKCKYINDCKTFYKYPMIVLEDPFPYLLDQKDYGKIIKGEIYEIPKENMEDLDYFEGVPTLYKRGKIKVIEDGKEEPEVLSCYFKAETIRDLKNTELISIYEEF